MSLTNQELEALIGTSRDSRLVAVLTVLRTGMNDWPSPVSTLDDYVNAIEETVKGVATKQNLEKYLQLHDFRDGAWKAESIAELLGIYDYYGEQVSLNEVLVEISKPAGVD